MRPVLKALLVAVPVGVIAQVAAVPGTPIVHQPPRAILNDRPRVLDLFVDLKEQDIESVSLFLRTDSSQTYREIPLAGEFGWYRYILPAEDLKGSTVTYYFLVTMRDYSLWAYPTGQDGRIEPFVIDLVPPTKEYFQKRYYD